MKKKNDDISEQELFVGQYSVLSTMLASEKRFKNLKTHFQTNGAVPRTHGNKAMDSKKATPFDVVEHVKHFIENYGAVNGLYLPGRVPGY